MCGSKDCGLTGFTVFQTDRCINRFFATTDKEVLLSILSDEALLKYTGFRKPPPPAKQEVDEGSQERNEQTA